MSADQDDWTPEDREPWERCGCGACQSTIALLYGDDEDE